MKPLLIVKTGSTFPAIAAWRGDFEDWIAAGLGLPSTDLQVAAICAGDPLPGLEEISGAVVTGSHDMVTDQLPWSEQLAGWLADLVDHRIPLLGICYGHQLLARALGGEAGYHPQGRELGTARVHLTPESGDDPLFRVLPPSFPAHVAHAQSALRLPPGARLLAANQHEPHHAFVLGDRAWGVQFHPEFDAGIARAYILEQQEAIQKEGLDPGTLLATVRPAPESRQLLRRFARIAREIYIG